MELAYEALTRSIRTVLTANSSAEMIRNILTSAQELLGAEAASVFLLEPDSEQLVLAGSTNMIEENVPPIRIKLGVGIAGWVAQNNTPVNLADVVSDPRFYSGIDRKTGFQTRGYLCVPLTVNDNVIGTIQLLNRTRGDIFSHEEFQLFLCFAALASLAIHKSQLHEAQIEKERLLAELALAETYQERMLPKSFFPPDDYAVTTHHKIARHLGGDYFDAFPSPHGFVLTIADVSGKGPGAALWMSGLANLLHYQSKHGSSPLEAISSIDRHFSEVFPLGIFITMFLAVVQDNILYYTSAGHNPMLLGKPDGGWEWLSSNGLPLGIMPDHPRPIDQRPFEPGSRLILFTDGIPEATSQKEECSARKSSSRS